MMIAAWASNRVLDNLDRKEPAALERLFRLLAIPSVSTDPAYHDFCIEAAEACVGALRKIGFEVRVVPILGKPMVRWALARAWGKARQATRSVLRSL